MLFEDFLCKKCNSGKNIQFMPKKHLRLELGRAARLLEKKGGFIEVETPSLLILRLHDMQIDLNASGKTIAKTVDKEKAEKAFQAVLPALEESELKRKQA